MRSHHFTIRLPNPVYRFALLRSKCLGYESLSEYMTNLVRCDGFLRRDHDLTVWLSQLSLPVQDFIDDRLERFPPAKIGTQPDLTHYFCAGLLLVETAGGKTVEEALSEMPTQLARLCRENGFGA